jgi:DNA primase
VQAWEGVLGLSIGFSFWGCDLRHHEASDSVHSPVVSLDPSPQRDLEEFTLVARVLWGF